MMTTPAHLDGIGSEMITTPRGSFHLLRAGRANGVPVIFVHGNVSSSTFWEETMLALPDGFAAMAPDLRGYGETERLPVDATRGLRDFSDDLYSLSQAMGVQSFHLVGHSMGGAVAMQYAIDHPQQLRSLTLVAPGSPYGFGGTRDIYGTPTWPDYAGSGGGLVNPEVLTRLAIGDRGEVGNFAPRQLLRLVYVKPPFRSPREDALVEGMVQTSTAADHYSRDMLPSINWPGIAPGTRGVNNALSPKYCNLAPLATISPKPPILWIRGADDRIVSDNAISDPGTLGAMGALPGWPGIDTYPPQPMIGQTRLVLERYKENGGSYEEVVIPDTGHMPYLEAPKAFLNSWLPFLQQHM
jgi:pimeloyl-ACP methyl ester carboxylesterase